MAYVNFQESLFFALVIHHRAFLDLVDPDNGRISLNAPVIHLDFFAKPYSEVFNLRMIEFSFFDDMRVKVSCKVVDMRNHRVSGLCHTEKTNNWFTFISVLRIF